MPEEATVNHNQSEVRFPRNRKAQLLGSRQAVKTGGFEPSMRRFDPYLPCQF